MPDLGKIRPTFVLKDQRLADLKALVPEAVADGAIDWTGLKQALGEDLEDDTQEPFGLSWPGKREAKKMAFTPPKGTLRPLTGQGIDVETTENLILEGDNLEVLKLLQKAYFGRVKMIYIDPPYNTGNDFVYSDNFTDTIDDYLRKTGALDADGKPLSTNPRTSGRFHSNWLSMIYPRLVVAKTLLRDDGVIFVSIDDNEVHHLRQVMDEVFGEENFVANISWFKKASPSNDAQWFSNDVEFIILYAKNKKNWKLNRLNRTEEQLKYYTNPDNDSRGPWNSATYTCNKTKDERPNLYYPITNPTTGEAIWPKETAVWKYAKELSDMHVRTGQIYWGADGRSTSPRFKLFLSDAGNVVPRTLWHYDDVGHTQSATVETGAFIGAGIFTTPKPVRLLTRMLQLATDSLPVSGQDDIVLDFFAGSGTTGQAVLELNRQDGGSRKFILVQIPEKTGRADFPTISDITKERVRRVITNLKASPPAAEEVAEATSGYLPKPPKDPPTSDLGFRVMALGPSNLKAWDFSQTQNLDDLERQLSIFADNPLAEGWKPGDLLVEVMLWEGFSPTSRVDVKSAGTDTFYRVTDPHLAYCLWCNFGTTHDFTLADLKALGAGADDLFVFLDSSLQNNLKSRLVDLVKIKVV